MKYIYSYNLWKFLKLGISIIKLNERQETLKHFSSLLWMLEHKREVNCLVETLPPFAVPQNINKYGAH